MLIINIGHRINRISSQLSRRKKNKGNIKTKSEDVHQIAVIRWRTLEEKLQLWSCHRDGTQNVMPREIQTEIDKTLLWNPFYGTILIRGYSKKIGLRRLIVGYFSNFAVYFDNYYKKQTEICYHFHRNI